jgi:hypothetical protein
MGTYILSKVINLKTCTPETADVPRKWSKNIAPHTLIQTDASPYGNCRHTDDYMPVPVDPLLRVPSKVFA